MLFKLLDVKKGVTSVVGSGGKTSVIHRLCLELSNSHKVIFTTSTHIYPSDTFVNLIDPSKQDILKAFEKTDCLCIGSPCDNGKFSASPIPLDTLKELADYVFIEADGSKGLPLKAHESFEPVIPQFSDDIILVVGASGFNKQIFASAHRSDVFARLAQCSIEDTADVVKIARVINAENISKKIFINQTDNENQKELAHKLAKLLSTDVYAGSLKEGTWYACNN